MVHTLYSLPTLLELFCFFLVRFEMMSTPVLSLTFHCVFYFRVHPISPTKPTPATKKATMKP